MLATSLISATSGKGTANLGSIKERKITGVLLGVAKGGSRKEGKGNILKSKSLTAHQQDKTRRSTSNCGTTFLKLYGNALDQIQGKRRARMESWRLRRQD